MTAIGLLWKYLPAELVNKVEDWDLERWEDWEDGDWEDWYIDGTFYFGSCSPYSYTAQNIILLDGPFKAAGGFGLVSVSLFPSPYRID